MNVNEELLKAETLARAAHAGQKEELTGDDYIHHVEPHDPLYTSTEVARLAGLTMRQLQWWDERKVIMPRHEGHQRLYDAEDLLHICVLAALRRKGLSLQKIRRVLRSLQRQLTRSTDAQYLLTDGNRVHLATGPQALDILSVAQSDSPIYFLDLARVREIANSRK